MSEKKVFMVVGVLVFFCACAGQGGPLPPYPKDALDVAASLNIDSQDQQTGDVAITYTLEFKNKSTETLEKVILKDFNVPPEIVMENTYFEISNLGPGEAKSVTFRVIVKGWGLNPKEQTWDVDFTVRIEKGSAYTEQEGFFYQITLYPK